MPLWDEHKQGRSSSKIADREERGGPRGRRPRPRRPSWRRFVGDTPWVHLDIAGTAWTSKAGPYQPIGATGVGVRLLLDLLRESRGA